MTTARPAPYDEDAELSALGACLLSDDVRADVIAQLVAEDFFHPDSAEVFRAIRSLHDKGASIDEIVLKEELTRRGRLDDKTTPALLVLDLVHTAGTGAGAREHVGIVKELALRRRALSRVEELRRAAGDGTNLGELAALAGLLSDELSDGAPMKAGPSVVEIDEFLSASEDGFDWIIPDVMERGDRLLLTAREGQGKSTLLKQIGIQVAAGMHPFRDEEIAPARVLIVDLENSARELRRRLRPMRIKVKDRLGAGRLFVVSQPAGIDLVSQPEERAWLESLIEHVAAEIVICGPLYKLADGDPNEEKSAKPVAKFLDTLRTRYGCALMLEAHMPHDGKGRPFGWSGWRRWPEIGLELTKGDQLKPWRPARHDTSGIPPALKRGGEFPFTVATRPRDVLWARIVADASQHLTRPSQRVLANALGCSIGLVNAVLKEHPEEWKEMFDD